MQIAARLMMDRKGAVPAILKPCTSRKLRTVSAAQPLAACTSTFIPSGTPIFSSDDGARGGWAPPGHQMGARSYPLVSGDLRFSVPDSLGGSRTHGESWRPTRSAPPHCCSKRVWSTDWFDNPELETDKLVAKLEALRLGPPRTFPDYQECFTQPQLRQRHSANVFPVAHNDA